MTIYHRSESGARYEAYLIKYNDGGLLIVKDVYNKWKTAQGFLTNVLIYQTFTAPDWIPILVKDIPSRKVKKYITSNLWLLDINTRESVYL